MGILILTSAAGAPGVTTLAVGLTLTWPRGALLADCDPAATQAVLAGYLRGQSGGGKGLLRVAEAHRDGRRLAESVLDQTLPLGEDQQPRLLLPGFTKPGSAGLFAGVWSALAEAFVDLDRAGIDVIVDAGRIPAQGLPFPLVERAEQTCLVSRSSLRAVAAARIHAETLLDQCGLVAPPEAAGLIMIGEGKPYGGSEIAKLLQLPLRSVIVEDQVAAARFSDGRPYGRRFQGSAFVKSLVQAGQAIFGRLGQHSERLGSPR